MPFLLYKNIESLLRAITYFYAESIDFIFQIVFNHS